MLLSLIYRSALAFNWSFVGSSSHSADRSSGYILVNPYDPGALTILSSSCTMLPSTSAQKGYTPVYTASQLWSCVKLVIFLPYRIATPRSYPLCLCSLTVHRSNSYSPPYVSRIPPWVPPSSSQADVGTDTSILATVSLSVQKSKGQSVTAFVRRPFSAAVTLAAVYG